MKNPIKLAIYKAITNNKWLSLKYKNAKGDVTEFFYGITDIDPEKGKISGDIFNMTKDLNCLEKPFPISIDGIISAEVIEESLYEVPSSLLEKIYSKKLNDYLQVSSINNDILQYLVECHRNDTDPFIRGGALIDGVIPEEFEEKRFYELDDKQFKDILDKVFKGKIDEEKMNRYVMRTMAFNILSIDFGNNKRFVIAYKNITINFKTKTLHISKDISFNKSFLIEDGEKKRRISISAYLDMSPDDFVKEFPGEDRREITEKIKANLHDGDIIDTRPTLFLLQWEGPCDFERAVTAINEMDANGALTFPLKSFFGRSRTHHGSEKTPLIVVSDKTKINIDQMRVVYNAMINHVTFVKGPPGTGKTETIFNVLLSSLVNKKKVLVCSNNNHPVSDIYEKLTNSFFWMNKYHGKAEPLRIPAIRLGNNDEMHKAVLDLKEIFKQAKELKDFRFSENRTQETQAKFLAKTEGLKNLLKNYEAMKDKQEEVDRLKKILSLSTTEAISQKVKEQIAIKERRVADSEIVTDEKVASKAISAKDDEDFKTYLYYSYLLSIKRLNKTEYKELRDIIEIDNAEEAVKKLNEYLKDDAKLKLFTDIFPIIVTTNLSAGRLGSFNPHFDLVIMDEAGQCSIASALIPIVKGSNLLLVGDTNQLHPVTVLDPSLNSSLREKYGIKEEYDYIDNSILSCMQAKDLISKSLLLSYHYRCAKSIASFPNARYYGHQLKLLNKNPGSLSFFDVENNPNAEMRNAYDEEARTIVNLVKKNNYKDVGIITPFVNQAAKINDLLEKENITDVKAGTVHTLQGSERNTIIMSTAISLRTGKKTYDWLKNNAELINVAVTRAKENFVLVGDKKAIDSLNKKENTDIKALVDYVYSNGQVEVVPSEVTLVKDFSNGSSSEKAFFDTVKPYFNRRGSRFRIERNVPVIDVLRSKNPDDIEIIGRKEFDVVISVKGGILSRYSPLLVFEIDGGEHIMDESTSRRDRIKEELCEKYRIKLIRIANQDVKDYEMIISVFETTIGGSNGISEMVQGSLFGDVEQESL